MPLENNLEKGRCLSLLPPPMPGSRELRQKVLELPHASTGDLLGQLDLLLARKEEANRPGGVGEGIALRVVVHLGGISEATVQPPATATWLLKPQGPEAPVELPPMLDCLARCMPLVCPLSSLPGPSTTGRLELSLPAPQRGGGSCSER